MPSNLLACVRSAMRRSAMVFVISIAWCIKVKLELHTCIHISESYIHVCIYFNVYSVLNDKNAKPTIIK